MDTTPRLKTVSTDTTEHRDLIAMSDTRVLDANSARCTQFASSGTVVLVDTFERHDEHGLRWDGDAPVFTAGVTNPATLRSALLHAGYRAQDVERVLDGEHELVGERGRAAVRAAGGDVAAVSPATPTAEADHAIATDGGLVQVCDPGDVAFGETVTLVYRSDRSANEVAREVTRENITGVGVEYVNAETGDGRITVTNGVVRSHTNQHTILGEFCEVRR